ncbi:hypothetical protein Q9L58_007633 [Maublancomyces gigas]|uniref:Ribosomal protein S15 n=1 Tax=Discina gigas TaxID=1032678 RepID=A0ABR3GBX7_9PEZI
MPPRLPLPSCGLSGLSGLFPSLRMSAPRLLAPFSTTPPVLTERKHVHRDKVTIANSEKRRIKNIKLQADLKTIRLSSAVNPVTGRDTSFVKSLEAAPPALPPVDWARANNVSTTTGHSDALHLNYYLTPQDLATAIAASKYATTPVRPLAVSGVQDTYIESERIAEHEIQHMHAVTAIHRIVSLSIGSNADRQRVNTIRCIDTFGRHVTDDSLPPDPNAPDRALSRKTPRAGPDTGSSEVQAAILTVKIRNVANMLKTIGGSKDKHNKRNLRLLCHRRQKLLKYLKRKEKGGVRYRNIMDALGLDEAAVQKELSM